MFKTIKFTSCWGWQASVGRREAFKYVYEFLINFHRTHHVRRVLINVTTIKIHISRYHRRIKRTVKERKNEKARGVSFAGFFDTFRFAIFDICPRCVRACVCLCQLAKTVVNKARCLFIQCGTRYNIFSSAKTYFKLLLTFAVSMITGLVCETDRHERLAYNCIIEIFRFNEDLPVNVVRLEFIIINRNMMKNVN